MIRIGGALTLMILMPISALAGLIETCHLKGQIVLDQPTQFECWKEPTFTIDKDTRIVTNGHPLSISADEILDVDGLRIVAFDDGQGKNGDGGRIKIEAATIRGTIDDINDNGAGNGAGGEIKLHVDTFKNFDLRSVSYSGSTPERAGGIWINTARGEIPLSELRQRM